MIVNDIPVQLPASILEHRESHVFDKRQLRDWVRENDLHLHKLHGQMKRVSFVLMGETGTTVCEIEMDCGHSVVGFSRPINTADFDIKQGMRMAFVKAREELWREMALIARYTNNPGLVKELPMEF